MDNKLTKEGLVSLIFLILACVFFTWGVNWQATVGVVFFLCLAQLKRGK